MVGRACTDRTDAGPDLYTLCPDPCTFHVDLCIFYCGIFHLPAGASTPLAHVMFVYT